MRAGRSPHASAPASVSAVLNEVGEGQDLGTGQDLFVAFTGKEAMCGLLLGSGGECPAPRSPDPDPGAEDLGGEEQVGDPGLLRGVDREHASTQMRVNLGDGRGDAMRVGIPLKTVPVLLNGRLVPMPDDVAVMHGIRPKPRMVR